MCSSKQRITGFALAGGRSVRMGQDKGLLRVGGYPLIQLTVNLLKDLTDQIFILGPPERYSFLKVPVLPDQVASQGPLSAIYTALVSSKTRTNLFLACDMPLMKVEFMELLVEKSGKVDAVLMRFDDGTLEPLCAIYNSSCLPLVKTNFENGKYRLSDLVAQLNVAYIGEKNLRHLGVDRRIFTNLNTLNDLKKLG